MQILFGERIGRSASLLIGSDSVIFDDKREKILLTRRSDNGQWCLPGGRLDPGETAVEACVREVAEETGLTVKVIRLIGVYSDPNFVVQYKDDTTYQVIAMCFESKIVGGAVGLSAETLDTGWFTPAEIVAMDVIAGHQQRINDALANREAAFMR